MYSTESCFQGLPRSVHKRASCCRRRCARETSFLQRCRSCSSTVVPPRENNEDPLPRTCQAGRVLALSRLIGASGIDAWPRAAVAPDASVVNKMEEPLKRGGNVTRSVLGKVKSIGRPVISGAVPIMVGQEIIGAIGASGAAAPD